MKMSDFFPNFPIFSKNFPIFSKRYLGQHPIRSEKTRHMVTAIHNITRDMQTISCYVDNAFGTPMRASRTIKIERKPRLKVFPERKMVFASIGAEVRIECEAGKT